MSLFQQLFGGDASGISQMLSPEQQAAINRQSMMALGARLLQNSRTPQRVSLAQGVGQALEAGLQAQQSGQMNAVQQMLLGQKIQESKDAAQQRQRFTELLGGGTPQPAMAQDQGVPAPTTQVGQMGAAPQAAGAASPAAQQTVLGMLSPEQRALIANLGPVEGGKQLLTMTQEAMKFGEPKPAVVNGQTVMVQTNALGQSRIAEGMQPYQAPPSEIATLQALGITPTLQGVTDLARARSVSVNMGGSGLKLTPAQEAIDKKFADTYLEWQTGGGSDSIANIAQVGTVLQHLESGQPLTGPMIGIQPDFVLALTNPRAAGAKEQVQEVVQRNLRVVLGAQFTEKEGNQLISRAYNPTLPPEQNAARLRKLFQQMAVSAQQRQAMVEYYEANGTLQGYKGPQPKITDFYKALEERSAPKAGDVVGGFRFKGGNPNDEANWERVR